MIFTSRGRTQHTWCWSWSISIHCCHI